MILSREEYPELYAAIAKAYGPLPGKDEPMKHIVPDDPEHPQANLVSDFHGEDIPYMSPKIKNITEQEAIEFLDQTKMAYRKAINESEAPELISQLRLEIRYWEDYLNVNWPLERAKREPFGGKTEPMTKQQLVEAMDYVYERLKQVHEVSATNLGFTPESRVVAEIYGSLKSLAAVVDEIVRKLE